MSGRAPRTAPMPIDLAALKAKREQLFAAAKMKARDVNELRRGMTTYNGAGATVKGLMLGCTVKETTVIWRGKQQKKPRYIASIMLSEPAKGVFTMDHINENGCLFDSEGKFFRFFRYIPPPKTKDNSGDAAAQAAPVAAAAAAPPPPDDGEDEGEAVIVSPATMDATKLVPCPKGRGSVYTGEWRDVPLGRPVSVTKFSGAGAFTPDEHIHRVSVVKLHCTVYQGELGFNCSTINMQRKYPHSTVFAALTSLPDHCFMVPNPRVTPRYSGYDVLLRCSVADKEDSDTALAQDSYARQITRLSLPAPKQRAPGEEDKSLVFMDVDGIVSQGSVAVQEWHMRPDGEEAFAENINIKCALWPEILVPMYGITDEDRFRSVVSRYVEITPMFVHGAIDYKKTPDCEFNLGERETTGGQDNLEVSAGLILWSQKVVSLARWMLHHATVPVTADFVRRKLKEDVGSMILTNPAKDDFKCDLRSLESKLVCITALGRGSLEFMYPMVQSGQAQFRVLANIIDPGSYIKEDMFAKMTPRMGVDWLAKQRPDGGAWKFVLYMLKGVFVPEGITDPSKMSAEDTRRLKEEEDRLRKKEEARTRDANAILASLGFGGCTVDQCVSFFLTK